VQTLSVPITDSLPNRKLLMSLLRILMCEAFGAEHGRACCDLFADVLERPETSEPPFDLILMDGSMPSPWRALKTMCSCAPHIKLMPACLSVFVSSHVRSRSDCFLTQQRHHDADRRGHRVRAQTVRTSVSLASTLLSTLIPALLLFSPSWQKRTGGGRGGLPGCRRTARSAETD
jgi:CheY-like chemotaxis protein